MKLNYRETTDTCNACGSEATDRKHNKPDEPQGLSDCPHCGSTKCCMCDMGDDVECPACDTGDDSYLD